MLARLYSLYQLVFSVFIVYLCQSLSSLVHVKRQHARESLSDNCWCSPYQLVLSVFVYVSLYPELSFYYCLQHFSLSLSNSVTDYRLSSSL